MRTFADTIKQTFTSFNKTIVNEVELANPLLNLVFADDGASASSEIGSHFMGTQSGNTLTITGFSWLDPSFPEISLANFDEQMVGQALEIQSDLIKENGNTKAIRKFYNITYPYEYDFQFEKTGIYVDIPGVNEYSSFKQNFKYPINLTWYGHKATYYVIFALDPALIKKGEEYLP